MYSPEPRNPYAGAVEEWVAKLHFIDLGYEIHCPTKDVGIDFVVWREDVGLLGVQVKSCPPAGVVTLHGKGISRSRYSAEERRLRKRAAALVRRAYDLLVLVNGQHIWVIPEAETRGITCIRVMSSGTGKMNKKIKWDKFKEELRFGRRTPQTTDVD